ncbi:fasciclin domain-containing protein [Janibacter indicus]|uniref:Fasciclin domain-containing protein n=1 Tax=Janibacter indicus TaxID=857417 RepID=A0A7L9IYG1_9MICO|nr:fasciclin domain-containing protein [Janibacter indicus]QOK22042.1 fasciclin domain-containing protein [Janibacter indicus]
MSRLTTTRTVALLAAAALPFALTACGDDSDTGSSASSSSSSESMGSDDSMSSSTDAAEAGAPFGEGCASVPEDGKGSFDGMSTDPVATAASNNPLLKTLVKAVTEADLAKTLNSSEDITVFAPTDDAFAAMDQATLDKAMGDPKGLLTTVLTHHVVEGRLAPEDLAGTHETLAGDKITVKGSGEDFTVGEANVVCGDVQTANATVYIVDSVLMPTAKK